MNERSDPIAEDALARLSREDRRAALMATDALRSATSGEPLTSLTQYALQEYLWVRLPADWPAQTKDRLQIAHALGRVLDLAGLPRYGAVCRAEVTAEVLRAWEEGERTGLAAARRASERSGMEPPDVDDLEWGAAMGPDEAAARWSCAATLELSIVAGTLDPARRAWRDAQRRIVSGHLDVARPELGGQTYRNAILTERLGRWIRTVGDERRAILEPVANMLLAPVAVPADAAEAMSRLRWFLERVGDGVVLTRAGFLPAPVVAGASSRFDSAGSARRETDVPQLRALRLFSERPLRAVRRLDGRLVLTASGRRLAGSTAQLWRSSSRALTAGDDFRAAVAELVLSVLVRRWRVPLRELEDTLASVLEASGWRGHQDEPLQRTDVGAELSNLLHVAFPLGMVRIVGDGEAQSLALTGSGRPAALEALRSRATRPGAV